MVIKTKSNKSTLAIRAARFSGRDVCSRLIECIRLAESREWIDEYFDLLNELLFFTGLRDEDPRLVLSITQEKKLPVTINSRYVLCAFRDHKPWTGYIFPAHFHGAEEFKQKLLKSWRFSDAGGDEAPYFCGFDGMPTAIFSTDKTGKIEQAWREAVLRELERGRRSPFRPYHQSVVFSMAVDRHYRNDIFDEVFS